MLHIKQSMSVNLQHSVQIYCRIHTRRRWGFSSNALGCVSNYSRVQPAILCDNQKPWNEGLKKRLCMAQWINLLRFNSFVK